MIPLSWYLILAAGLVQHRFVRRAGAQERGCNFARR